MNLDNSDTTDNKDKELIMAHNGHKPHPAMRVRRTPANSDNLLGSVKPVKVVKPVNLDMPDKPVKSDGRQIVRPVRAESDMTDICDNSGDRYEGLDEILSPMMAQTDQATANWTFRYNNPETDKPNKEVTTHIGWSVLPNSDISPERPKRLTKAQLAQKAPIHAKRAEMREYRALVNAKRTGQFDPTLGMLPMGAEIPVNLDTNDATDDVLKERKGDGSRVLINATTSVHSDGKWATRTNTVYAKHMREGVKVDMPGKGHTLVKRVIGWHVGQFGQVRSLADFAGVENGHLELVARFMPYEAKMVKTGERLTSDNLGIRHQDGETDISGKVLELNGKNNRVAKANSDNARKRHEKAKSAKSAKQSAREQMMSELTALARKVHDEKKAPFAPMTRAEREIGRQIG